MDGTLACEAVGVGRQRLATVQPSAHSGRRVGRRSGRSAEVANPPVATGSPGDELPDLGLEFTGPATNVGEQGDGPLEVLHGLLVTPGGMELVGQVVLDRGLEMALARPPARVERGLQER